MFRKVLTIAAIISASTAEPPVQANYTPAEAVSSQSFTRHDVSLYKQTSTHPKHVAQTIKTISAAPINNAYPTYASPAPVTYVTPAPSRYSGPSSEQFQYSTPSSEQFQYSTPSSEQYQYSTPSPSRFTSQGESDYISRPVQALHTKVRPVGPNENSQQSEFTQAYFLPSTSSYSDQGQYSGKAPQYTQQTQSSKAAPQQYYVMVAQPQYSTGPVQFQSAPVQYQAQPHVASAYQAQPSAVQYVSSSQYPQQQQQYAFPQYEIAYRVAAPSNDNNKQMHGGSPLAVEYQGYSGSSASQGSSKSSNAAPVIAKFSPAAFTPAKSFTKSAPISFQPAYTKSAPVYTVSPSYVKSSSPNVQPALVYALAPTQYVETSPSYQQSSSKVAQTAPNYVKSSNQYVEAPPSYGQSTQLYPVPSNTQQYYTHESQH